MKDNNELLSLLSYGSSNGVHSQELMETLSISKRDLLREISNLRINGHLVCADCHGYYLADSKDEIRRYVMTTSKKACTLFRTLRTFRHHLKECDSQLTLVLQELAGGVEDDQ